MRDTEIIKFVEPSAFTDPDVAARKLVEIASTVLLMIINIETSRSSKNLLGTRVATFDDTLRYSNPAEETKMNFKLIGATALAISVLSGPAFARPVGESIYCATREPGNPHSRLCDYIMWSKWRERGGWDASLDNACFHNPAFVPGECGLDPRSRQSVAW